MDALHPADRITRRAIPVLALPLVHVRPDHVAVRAVELGVDVEDSLHVVVAGGDVAQARRRKAEGVAIDHGVLARRKRVDVDPEEGHAGHPGREIGHGLPVRPEERHAVLPGACLQARLQPARGPADLARPRRDDVRPVDARGHDEEHPSGDRGRRDVLAERDREACVGAAGHRIRLPQRSPAIVNSPSARNCSPLNQALAARQLASICQPVRFDPPYAVFVPTPRWKPP